MRINLLYLRIEIVYYSQRTRKKCVAVCDDDERQANALDTAIDAWMSKAAHNSEIHVFSSEKRFCLV